MTATTKTGKITLIFFALLLAFCVVLAAVTLAPANTAAAEGEDGETPATDIHANHDGWTELPEVGGTISSGNYYLSADVQLQNTIYVSGEVTLCLNGFVLRGYETQFVIQVINGGSLTLCDCQSESEAEEHRHNYYVAESGLYVFDDGTDKWTAAYNAAENTGAVAGGVITGGNAADYGGGVYVKVGTFTMSGGTISGNTANYGGGVYVEGGTFTMTGGTISGNIANYGGGGVYVTGDTFTMSGGTISGNTAGSGGGVYVAGNTFEMKNGTISGNTASGNGGGVLIGGIYKLINDTIVYLGGTFTMSGGYLGGTVYVSTDAEVSVSGGYSNENLKDYVAEGHTLCDISSRGAEFDED